MTAVRSFYLAYAGCRCVGASVTDLQWHAGVETNDDGGRQEARILPLRLDAGRVRHLNTQQEG